MIPLALCVVLLAACAPTPQEQPAPAPVAESTPTPSTQPPAGAVPAFGGDCANMLAPEQLQPIIGGGIVDTATWSAQNHWDPDFVPAPELAYGAAAGGLECSWRATEGASLSITVLAMPTRVMPTHLDFTEPRCDERYDMLECRASRTVGETWLLALQQHGFDADADTSGLVAALDAAGANLAGHPSPVPAERTDAWWNLPGCEELGSRIGLADLIGEGYHEGVPEGTLATAETTLLEHAGLGLTCPWFAFSEAELHHDAVTLEVAPGAASQWERLVDHPSAAAIEVLGAASAMTVPDQGRIVATDGVNVIIVTGYEEDSGDLVRQLAEGTFGAFS